MLPWAIFVTTTTFPQSSSWTYYAINIGGANVFDFFDVSLAVTVWAWTLMKGKIKVTMREASHENADARQ
jgi:hypothetical protein